MELQVQENKRGIIWNGRVKFEDKDLLINPLNNNWTDILYSGDVKIYNGDTSFGFIECCEGNKRIGYCQYINAIIAVGYEEFVNGEEFFTITNTIIPAKPLREKKAKVIDIPSALVEDEESEEFEDIKVEEIETLAKDGGIEFDKMIDELNNDEKETNELEDNVSL